MIASLSSAGPREFGRMLREALWTDEALAVLREGCGWNDGGCATLSTALLRVLGGSLNCRSVAIVSNGRRTAIAKERITQHVLVEVTIGSTCWYLDGDGASQEAELLNRWSREEGLLNPSLVPAGLAPFESEITARSPEVDALVTYLSSKIK